MRLTEEQLSKAKAAADKLDLGGRLAFARRCAKSLVQHRLSAEHVEKFMVALDDVMAAEDPNRVLTFNEQTGLNNALQVFERDGNDVGKVMQLFLTPPQLLTYLKVVGEAMVFGKMPDMLVFDTSTGTAKWVVRR